LWQVSKRKEKTTRHRGPRPTPPRRTLGATEVLDGKDILRPVARCRQVGLKKQHSPVVPEQ